jgi:transcriptional regulator with XRE-family HTH domain
VSDTSDKASRLVPDSTDYAKRLGAKLRTVRQQQNLSLQRVQELSDGRWKAVVVGSYERGDRALTVARLAELADFYNVTVAEIVPSVTAPPPVLPLGWAEYRVVIDLVALRALPRGITGPLARFARAIQGQRHAADVRTLSLRREDVRSLAVIYGRGVSDLMSQLEEWGVVMRRVDVADYSSEQVGKVLRD